MTEQPDIRDILKTIATADAPIWDMDPTPPLELPDGYRLVMTALACPEQYDLLDQDGEPVGYFRLRHAHFTVSCPSVGGTYVYSRAWDDDPWKGTFDSQEERQRELQAGVCAVLEWQARGGKPRHGDQGRCNECAFAIEFSEETAAWSHVIDSDEEHDAAPTKRP